MINVNALAIKNQFVNSLNLSKYLGKLDWWEYNMWWESNRERHGRRGMKRLYVGLYNNDIIYGYLDSETSYLYQRITSSSPLTMAVKFECFFEEHEIIYNNAVINTIIVSTKKLIECIPENELF